MSASVHMPSSELAAHAAAGPRTRRRSYSGVIGVGVKCLQIVLLLSLAFASYLFISHYLLASVQVVGESMLPSLHDAEHLLLNRWIYHLRTPRAGDIVVFHDPLDHSLAVKRVIGVPGDAVEIKSGGVFLNGCKLSEPYLARNMPTFPFMTRSTQFFVCDRGRYLVLGDNRKNSADSRTYGLISREDILGRIVR